MKAGTFNIHDYLEKLYDVDESKYNSLNEEKADTENGDPEDGLIQQGGENKAYNWLKKEFQHGKTEVKVEMSYHTFKPGYNLEDGKSTKDFPGMYSDVKNNTSNKPESTAAPFPETKFPGMGGESNSAGDSDTKTKADLGNTIGKKEPINASSEGEGNDDDDDKAGKEQNGIKVEAKEKKEIKVEAKTKEDVEEEEKEKKEKKKINEAKSKKDQKGFDAWIKTMEKRHPDFNSREAVTKDKYAKQITAAMKRFSVNED